MQVYSESGTFLGFNRAYRDNDALLDITLPGMSGIDIPSLATRIGTIGGWSFLIYLGFELGRHCNA